MNSSGQQGNRLSYLDLVLASWECFAKKKKKQANFSKSGYLLFPSVYRVSQKSFPGFEYGRKLVRLVGQFLAVLSH